MKFALGFVSWVVRVLVYEHFLCYNKWYKKKKLGKEGLFAMILPQEKKYKGPLGEFTYNSQDFELMYRYTPLGSFEVLKYRGPETEGDKIHIPDGIVDCSYMFEKQSLRTPPVIPVTVRTANYMFKDCVSLVRGALLPYGTKSASFMYQGCRSLEMSSALPDTLQNAQYMYDGCRMLKQPPRMGTGLLNVTGMFRDCLSLESLADFPNGVLKKKHVYRNCRLLKDVLGSSYEESHVERTPDDEEDTRDILEDNPVISSCFEED